MDQILQGNKILQHWDLHSCGAPKWHTSCDLTPNSFDVIMIRDALQHISIDKARRWGFPCRIFLSRKKTNKNDKRCHSMKLTTGLASMAFIIFTSYISDSYAE